MPEYTLRWYPPYPYYHSPWWNPWWQPCPWWGVPGYGPWWWRTPIVTCDSNNTYPVAVTTSSSVPFTFTFNAAEEQTDLG